MKIYGDKWNKISELIPGRNDVQCRSRWESIKPDIKRNKWTKDEDSLLIEKYDEYNGSWVKIAEDIPGRTGDQCKHRYNSILNIKQKKSKKE